MLWGDDFIITPLSPAALILLYLFNHLPLPKILIPQELPSTPKLPKQGPVPELDAPAAGDALPVRCTVLAERKCPLCMPQAVRRVQELRNWNRLNNGSCLLEENEICPHVTENLHSTLTAHYKEKVSETQQMQGAQLEKAINSDSRTRLIYQSISAFAQSPAISLCAAARAGMSCCRTAGSLSVQLPELLNEFGGEQTNPSDTISTNDNNDNTN